jgi:type-F conjugative transfer system pilin assembly protein TrbC
MIRAIPWCVLALCAVLATRASATDPSELAKTARERAQSTPVTVPKSSAAPVDPARIEELARTARERGKKELQRLVEARERDANLAPSEGAIESGSPRRPGSRRVGKGRVIVALSSSMPPEMVREYMRQSHGVGEVIVVLRGFIGGAREVKPTGRWLEEVMRKQPSCGECPHYLARVVVDPLVYRSLNITRVPAIAYVPEIEELQHCDGEALESAGIVYGAVSIAAGLKRLRQDGVAVPAELLKVLGGST